MNTVIQIVAFLAVVAAAFAIPRPSTYYEDNGENREARASKGFYTAHMDVSNDKNEDTTIPQKYILPTVMGKSRDMADVPSTSSITDVTETEPIREESPISVLDKDATYISSTESHEVTTEDVDNNDSSTEMLLEQNTNTFSSGSFSDKSSRNLHQIGFSKSRDASKSKLFTRDNFDKTFFFPETNSKSSIKSSLPIANLRFNLGEKRNYEVYDTNSNDTYTQSPYFSSPPFMHNKEKDRENFQHKSYPLPVRRQIIHQQTILNPLPYYRQYVGYNIPQTNFPSFSRFSYVPQLPQKQIPQSEDSSKFEIFSPYARPQTNVPFQDFPNSSKGQSVQNNNALMTVTDHGMMMPVNSFSNQKMDSTNFPTPSMTEYFSRPLNSNPYKSYINPFTAFPAFSSDYPNTWYLGSQMSTDSRASWPFSDYFPVVIHDPFLSMYNAFTNMIEYGPEADVCRKTNKIGRQSKIMSGFNDARAENRNDDETIFVFENGKWTNSEEAKENMIAKRSTDSQKETDIETLTVLKNNSRESKDEEGNEDLTDKPETVVSENPKEDEKETEIVMTSGNAVGGSGPYVTKLVVRKGGVSIAGPGGIATAGSGGTAIVGPGGVAYTSPNGLAVVGPGGKVVGLPSGVDVVLGKVTSGLVTDGSQPRLLDIPPGGRILATGPVVYYHPSE